MEYYDLTGLTTGQLHKLSLLVMQEIGSLVKAGAKKPPAAGLLDSVVMGAFEVSRDRVGVQLPYAFAWELRSVSGGGIRGCRRCGRAGAGSEGS